VDARWSSGRVLREYTLFLDPPTLAAAPPARRAAQTPSEPEVARAPEPAEPESRPVPSQPAPVPAPASERPVETERAVAEERPSPEQRSADPGGQVIGPVASGQTLWGIAQSWRPDSSLTMNQVMLAILDRNPQAFIDGNVNRLMRGAELTMPLADELRALGVAEADRRMAAQMQSWEQRSATREVPVIAEAAVPEVDRFRETPAETPEPELVHRLEVVPPESDIFDDGSAVSDGEVERASNRLSDLEDQMYAEALDSEELIQHAGSIRDAIRTREAAGLAVADEEMAMFEARLRDARDAREQDERLMAEAELADDEASAYFRELEAELGTTDDGAERGTEPLADGRETSLEMEPEAAADEQAVPVEVAALDEARTDSAGLPFWLWLVAATVLAGAAVAGLFWARRRRAAESAVVGSKTNDVEAQRKRVASSPENLAAHLALLRALAADDESEAFSDALDDMYRRVEHDDDPRWQEALNLAVTQAPDHPLLTPNETALGEGDDGLDDRTREMLGILGASPDKDEDDAQDSPDDYRIDSNVKPGDEVDADDEFFGDEQDESDEADEPAIRLTPGPSDANELDDLDATELDLAELSNRLDDSTEGSPAEMPSEEESTELLDLDSDDSELELDVFEDSTDKEASESTTDDTSDDSTEDDALDLDFNFSPAQHGSDTQPAAFDPDELALDEASVAHDVEGVDDAVDDAVDDDNEKVDDLDDDRHVRGDRELEAFLGRDARLDPEQDDGLDDGAGEMAATKQESQGLAEDEGEPELSDEDAEVKLDLARAYLSMDDPDSARTLLEEITSGGSAAMRAQAHKLVDSL
ncbi:MAG: FimV/HubP family polar landmark protein, partial [Wenzhouxiangella sp.]